MSDLVGYETEGRVAILPIDNPPVNALGIGVREGLMRQLDRAAADDGVDAIVIIGVGRTFPAGADIREFDQPTREPHLIGVVDHLDTIEKPVVAAIHGTALGGGLELALGCHFRVASPSARMGTPEVNLGIFPGAAGTQRLPRVAGLDHALELIVLGRPVGAAKAKDYGIVDAVIEGDLRSGAVAFAERIVADGTPRKISSEPRAGIGSPEEHADTITKYRDLANRGMRGQDSPHQAIDSVIDGMTMSYPEAVQADRKRFETCKNSDQSRALRYAFFAEREAAKIPDIGKEVTPREIASTGVIGAGTMGRGIAVSLSDSGLPVTVVETSQEAVDTGLAAIAKLYDGMVRRGRIDDAEKDRRLARISGAVGFDALGAADLVVEAAFEDLDVKKEIFARLDAVAKPGAILATNTSYMDIDAIAAVTNRPADVIGLHYFVPANAMRLLDLHDDVQAMVCQGLLTVGHAKAVLSIKDPKAHKLIAEQIIRRQLTVRAAEKLAQDTLRQGTGSDTTGSKGSKGKQDAAVDAQIRAITNRLRGHLATHVVVSHGSKKGKIEIEYYGDDDLQRLLDLLGLESE